MTAGVFQPKVVALVPAWKASAFISRTLDALAAQSVPNLEILVSDDASPDETAAICERYAARDARFRVIRQPRNLGWTGNVNSLLGEAQGVYFLFAFHDDLLEPTYIERCVAALEANQGAILAFSDIELVRQDGSREELLYTALDGVTDRETRARLIAGQVGDWWIPNRGVFRACAVPALGGLRRHLAGEFSADWPWLLHMSLLGEFVRIPVRLCTKIYRQGSVSRSWDFSSWSWGAVTLSAMGAVYRARIPLREKPAVYGALIRFIWRQLSGPARRRLARSARALGFRSSRPHPEPPGRGKPGRSGR